MQRWNFQLQVAGRVSVITRPEAQQSKSDETRGPQQEDLPLDRWDHCAPRLRSVGRSAAADTPLQAWGACMFPGRTGCARGTLMAAHLQACSAAAAAAADDDDDVLYPSLS